MANPIWYKHMQLMISLHNPEDGQRMLVRLFLSTPAMLVRNWGLEQHNVHVGSRNTCFYTCLPTPWTFKLNSFGVQVCGPVIPCMAGVGNHALLLKPAPRVQLDQLASLNSIEEDSPSWGLTRGFLQPPFFSAPESHVLWHKHIL